MRCHGEWHTLLERLEEVVEHAAEMALAVGGLVRGRRGRPAKRAAAATDWLLRLLLFLLLLVRLLMLLVLGEAAATEGCGGSAFADGEAADPRLNDCDGAVALLCGPSLPIGEVLTGCRRAALLSLLLLLHGAAAGNLLLARVLWPVCGGMRGCCCCCDAAADAAGGR